MIEGHETHSPARWQRPRARLATVAAVLALVTGACGSSASHSNASQNTSSTSSGGATGTPVKLMVIGAIQSADLSAPEIVDGAKAAATAVNAAGGIDGHPIQILSCNDQFDPNQAATCAEQAVSDHVAAVVGSLTAGGTTVLPILAAAHIADFADFPLSPIEYTDADSFPIYGGELIEALGEAEVLHVHGVTKATIAWDGQTSAQVVRDTLAGALKTLGISYTSLTIPTTTTDMAPWVSRVLSGGTEAVVMQLFPNQVQSLLQQAGAQGKLHSALFVMSSSVLNSSEVGALNGAGDGAYVAGGFPLVTDTSSALSQFRTEMSASAPSAAQDFFSLNSWAGVHVLATIATQAHAFNAAEVLAAVQSVKGLNTLWLSNWSTTPSSIPNFTRVFSLDAWIGVIQNGTMTPSQGPLSVSNLAP